MMGLRLAEGVPLVRFEAEAGKPFAACLDAARLGRLVSGGFLTIRDGRLYATDEGRQRLDAVLGALLG
jgi:coproporphyrinogen III oxidase-like Fe-S oxidoreductase